LWPAGELVKYEAAKDKTPVRAVVGLGDIVGEICEGTKPGKDAVVYLIFIGTSH
jgi:hypothetical protein